MAQNNYINDPELHSIISRIYYSTGALLLTYTETIKRINYLSENIKWYNPEDSRRNNKDRMKELGGGLFNYREQILELTIIGIARNVETIITSFKQIANIRIDFWTDCNNLKYYYDMKVIRHLNNIVKHYDGIIVDNNNPNSRFLIDIAGFSPDSKIVWAALDIEKYIYKSFVFQHDLFHKFAGGESRFKAYEESDLDQIKGYLISDLFS